MVLFQLGPERGEARGKLPVAKDRRMVQCSGLLAQRREVMDRIENHGLFLEGSFVRCDDLAVRHDHDLVDVALDRHHLEGKPAWHAVTIAVEGDGLKLVDRDRRPDHARVEPMLG